MRRQLRLGWVAVMAAVGAACGGGDSATLEFVESELVWVVDGAPVGAELSYAEPIERDRFERGIRWEARFNAAGDVDDVESSLFRRISINGDLIEAPLGNIGPELGLLAVAAPFEISVDGDAVTASVNVDRPVSAASLAEERRRFETATGLDADAEQIDVGNGFEVNVDQIVDLPPGADGSVNEYEYRVLGDVTIANGNVVEIDDSIELRVLDSVPVADLDLAASCDGLSGQYLEQVAAQLDQPDMVLIDRRHASRALTLAAFDRECAPADFALAVCSGARSLVDASGGDPAQPPWSEVTVLCPSGAEFAESTVIDATVSNGVAQLTVAATAGGLAPLSVAIALPDWTIGVMPARLDGQELEVVWPGARDSDDASMEIAISVMSASQLDARFARAISTDELGGVEVARDAGERDGRRWEWAVTNGSEGYRFGAALALADERLLAISGAVTEDDGRAPTDESVTELIGCIVESIAVGEWSPGADPPEALTACRSVGTFAPT